jgi:uncharacterized DUF497 family protein
LLTIEWDEEKRRANRRKHGVEFADVSAREATRREQKQYEG